MRAQGKEAQSQRLATPGGPRHRPQTRFRVAAGAGGLPETGEEKNVGFCGRGRGFRQGEGSPLNLKRQKTRPSQRPTFLLKKKLTSTLLALSQLHAYKSSSHPPCRPSPRPRATPRPPTPRRRAARCRCPFSSSRFNRGARRPSGCRRSTFLREEKDGVI